MFRLRRFWQKNSLQPRSPLVFGGDFLNLIVDRLIYFRRIAARSILQHYARKCAIGRPTCLQPQVLALKMNQQNWPSLLEL
jgi:hypothetical protein